MRKLSLRDKCHTANKSHCQVCLTLTSFLPGESSSLFSKENSKNVPVWFSFPYHYWIIFYILICTSTTDFFFCFPPLPCFIKLIHKTLKFFKHYSIFAENTYDLNNNLHIQSILEWPSLLAVVYSFSHSSVRLQTSTELPVVGELSFGWLPKQGNEYLSWSGLGFQMPISSKII